MIRTYAHRLEGRCHCGALGYLLETDQAPESITVRRCYCDFCRRHRPRYWSDPDGRLSPVIADPARIARYRFGQGNADFVLCRDCGAFAFAIAEVDGSHYAVANLNLALAADARPTEVRIEAEEESRAERDARRRARWTPVTGPWPPV